MNKKPWYMDDNIIIFAFTIAVISFVASLIFYLEIINPAK